MKRAIILSSFAIGIAQLFAAVAVAAFTPTTTSYNDPAIAYSSGWSMHPSGWAETSAPGASASFSFSGSGIKLVADRVPYGGGAEIYIDGVLQQSVTFYSATTVGDATIYEKTGLSAGAHSIRLVAVTGWSYVEKVVVSPTVTTVGHRSLAFVYTGSWTDHPSDWHEANQINATATVTFSGTGVAWISDKFSYGGTGDIYIDNVFQKTVSFANAQTMADQVVFQKEGLAAGTHTIRLVVKSGWNFAEKVQSVSTTTLTRINLASASIQAPAAYPYGTDVVARAFDGNVNTYYRSDSRDFVGVTFTFSSSITVSRLRALIGLTGDDYHLFAYKLEAADSAADLNGATGSYVLLVDASGAKGAAWEERLVTSTTRKVWRFSTRGYSYGGPLNALSELELWGAK